MRPSAVLSVILIIGTLAISTSTLAQHAVGPASAEQRDIGRLETRIQRYDQALGVIAQFARPLGAEIECNGICYFPSSTQSTSWRCAPKERCDLHCDVSPPVGGCDCAGRVAPAVDASTRRSIARRGHCAGGGARHSG